MFLIHQSLKFAHINWQTSLIVCHCLTNSVFNHGIKSVWWVPDKNLALTFSNIDLVCLVYEGCNFVISEDMASSGAAKVNGADTLDACLSACKGDQENCKAVEYSEQYKCYMHSEDTYEANLASDTGVNVYKFQDCGKCQNLFWFRM